MTTKLTASETFENFRKDLSFVEKYLKQFVVCVCESPTDASGRADTLVAKDYKCPAKLVKERRLKCGLVGKEYTDSNFTTIVSLTQISAFWQSSKAEGVVCLDIDDSHLEEFVQKKVQTILEKHTPSQKQLAFPDKVVNPNLEIRIQLNADQIKSLQETGELVITSKGS